MLSTMIRELLLIDIETVPRRQALSALDLEEQSLFWDKIAKTVPENTTPEDAYRQKAGILAEFGQVVCISTAFFYTDASGKNALRVKAITGKDEVEILRIFTELCDQLYRVNPHFRFAGHNIKEFDIPFICRRMVIHQLALPPYLRLQDRKPWEVNLFDTMNWWKFGDHKHYTSLKLLARVLGIPGAKTDMDGSQVQDVYYRDGNLPRIADYCCEDVVVTANIILRFLNLPLLEKEQVVRVD